MRHRIKSALWVSDRPRQTGAFQAAHRAGRRRLLSVASAWASSFRFCLVFCCIVDHRNMTSLKFLYPRQKGGDMYIQPLHTVPRFFKRRSLCQCCAWFKRRAGSYHRSAVRCGRYPSGGCCEVFKVQKDVKKRREILTSRLIAFKDSRFWTWCSDFLKKAPAYLHFLFGWQQVLILF